MDPDIPLLRTKLQPPRIRPGMVPRRELVQRLAEGAARKLTLITAPAGYGKTSLLLSWLGRAEMPVAWLSLDENDNDLTRSLAYLIASLGTTPADPGTETFNLLNAPNPPPPTAVLTMVINQLAEYPGDITLVLDDFHTLTDSALQEAFSFFIEHAPPQLHFIIAGRTTPSLPRSKYRARHQLAEINAGHLSFSLDEAAQFFQNALGLEITPEALQKLHAQTEGWVTGLQIAGLAAQTETSPQNTRERAEYLEAFSGEHGYLFDYLGAEVLDQLSPARQQFLLQTAILNELNAPLCTAVTGLANSRGLLEQLESDHLFTVALDAAGGRYRYHHLFQDFLQTQAEERFPEAIPGLHRKAGAWYAAHGQHEAAIRHGLLSDDPAWTANLIADRADTMWTHQEMRALRRWIESLPEAMRQASPKIGLYNAWTLLMTGDFPGADQAIHGLKDSIPPDAPPELHGIAAVVEATYRVQTNQPGAIERYQKAIEYLPKTAMNWLGGAYLGLGMAHYWGTGDLAAASRWLAEAVDRNRRIGNAFAALYANYFLGQAQIGRGRLVAARQTYREALAWIDRDGTVPQLMGSWAYLGLGEILLERNRPGEAAENLLEAVRLGKQRENKEIIVKGLLGLARIEAASGFWDQVQALLQEAEAHVHRPGIPDMSAAFSRARAHLALRQGDLSPAQAARPDAQPWEAAPILPWEVPDRFLQARLLLAEGSFQEAHNLLVKLEKAAPPQQRAAWLEISISRALALAGADQTEAAIRILSPALSFAAHSGHQWIFLAEGEKMAGLLARIEGADAAGRYARVLLDAFGVPAAQPAFTGTALIEPLSDAEADILRFLAQGLTNDEIASRRVVSVNTVKWHLKNIYGKLGVKNRTAAVATARELGVVG